MACPTPCAAVSCTRLADVLSCHCISDGGGGAVLATCPNDNTVVLHERSAGGHWQQSEVLTRHEQVVPALDWHCGEGGTAHRLVSCSHDGNSYVWTRQAGAFAAGGRWKPELVVTKLARAGLCVRWAPGGTKFAIGSGEATVCVCVFDLQRGLWAPKTIRNKHNSSVMGLAWHPNGLLLATVSTDCRLRVFNAHVPAVDGRNATLPALGSSSFGARLLDLPTGCGWGLHVAWSPSGCTLAWCGQRPAVVLLDGLHLQVAEAWQRAEQLLQVVRLPGLPLKCLAFLSERALVGGGFDAAPLLLTKPESGGQWAVQPLHHQDTSTAARAAAGPPAAGIRSFMLANERDENAAQPDSIAAAQAHCNCIVSISRAGEREFTTAGLDGRVVEWRLGGA